MIELAKLAYTYGGWWIWFEVYGQRFSVAHYPNEGFSSVRIDLATPDSKDALVSSPAELAEYVRKYCPEAPVDDDEVLKDIKESVKHSLSK